MQTVQELVFVYNADSGFFSNVADAVHKVMSPETYQCNLCAITYGNLTMKDEWKEFIEHLPYEVTFLHKDEFIKRFPQLSSVRLPAIFIGEQGGINEIISADEINKQNSVKELKNLIGEKLRKR